MSAYRHLDAFMSEPWDMLEDKFPNILAALSCSHCRSRLCRPKVSSGSWTNAKLRARKSSGCARTQACTTCPKEWLPHLLARVMKCVHLLQAGWRLTSLHVEMLHAFMTSALEPLMATPFWNAGEKLQNTALRTLKCERCACPSARNSPLMQSFKCMMMVHIV